MLGLWGTSGATSSPESSSICSRIDLSVVALTPTSMVLYTIEAVDFCATPIPTPKLDSSVAWLQALTVMYKLIIAIIRIIILYLYYYKTSLKSSLNTINGQHTLHHGSRVHIGIQVLRVVTLCSIADTVGFGYLGSTRTFLGIGPTYPSYQVLYNPTIALPPWVCIVRECSTLSH